MIIFSEDKLSNSDFACELFDVIKIVTTINKTLNIRKYLNFVKVKKPAKKILHC